MRAVVLSSGGSRGHYHIGALQYLYTEQHVKHEILCGNSIGAIICAYLGQYPYSQESFGIARLSELFLDLEDNDVYKRWRPFGIVNALFSKTSVYDSAPVRNLIKTRIDQMRILDTSKRLRIGVTLQTPCRDARGKLTNYRIYRETDADLLKAIMASCALVPFFEAVPIGTNIGMDGGVQTVTPIKAAIDAGANEIDVIVCYPTYLSYPKNTEHSIYTEALYVIDLMLNRLTWLDIERTSEINSLISTGAITNKRPVKLNVIYPSADLDVPSLSFNRKDGERLQKRGWDDAKLSHQ